MEEEEEEGQWRVDGTDRAPRFPPFASAIAVVDDAVIILVPRRDPKDDAGNMTCILVVRFGFRMRVVGRWWGNGAENTLHDEKI